ncbi:MAG TPA: molybdopterin cofactor-binding domain-containing protein [Candidatus Dormibacteraeota bacterium]|nr:molybdopterin cofactor-binding domain-containing protein [Candidatus Dormibacteraeota bacterium]
MIDDPALANNSAAVEPERYEFRAPAAHRFELQRRDFFKFLGAGVLVVCALKELPAQESGAQRPGGFGFFEPLPKEISAWMHVGENGTVTVYTGKVEIGQNIRTSLSQAVAEELRFPIAGIQMVMGDTQLTPYDMGTFGSRTTPTMNLQLRKVAAAAREELIALAAKKWNIDPRRLEAANGRVKVSKKKKSISYSELVSSQQLTTVIPADEALVAPAQWTVEGQSIPKVDGRDFVTGRHLYPSDQKLPGMLYGKVLRPPSFGATLVSINAPSFDLADNVTFVRDGDFAGVAAASAEAAERALASLKAKWNEQPQLSNKDLFAYLKNNPIDVKGFEGTSRYETGAVDKDLAAADHQLRQTYTVSYIAHAPLEPRAALAQWTSSGNMLTVWTGTQRPFAVRTELAQAFHVPEDQVRVLMPDMGSGYGGKHTGECAVEAARLARAANAPVKLVWTREEEFTWAYFRPAGVIEVAGGVQNDGTLSAWEFKNYNSGAAGIRTFYEVPSQRIVFQPTRYPLRQGSYRALAATANHFARESFMDELAHAANVDPLQFRLKNLKNERLRAVFQAAADKFGWTSAKPAPGHGFGIGGGFEKGGNVATCVEVAVDRASGEVGIVRVITAFECGAIVNPDNLKNQIIGANIMGLGGALFEAIEFQNGRVLNPRFSKYRVPRFSDVPQIDVVLLDREDVPPAGAGETPLVGLAPAIGNAIFQAADIRLRSLPLVPDGLKTA